MQKLSRPSLGPRPDQLQRVNCQITNLTVRLQDYASKWAPPTVTYHTSRLWTWRYVVATSSFLLRNCGIESTKLLCTFTSRRPTETSAMYIKSSFPDQAKVLDCNAYEALWNRHEQARWSNNLILHIEEKSGRKWTYQEFHTQAVLVATALGSPISDGSLGFRKKGEIIAIISHNSLVREAFQHWSLIHCDFQDYAILVHSLLLLAMLFALFNPSWTSFESNASSNDRENRHGKYLHYGPEDWRI